MDVRSLLASCIVKTKIHKIYSSIYHNVMPSVTVLAYHRIKNINSDFLYDRELISASTASFEAQIKYIKNNFNVITCKELSDAIYSNKKLPKKSLLITFDDGFDDNYINAYPILKSHNIPAAFFVSSGYIDSQLPYWFDLIYMVYTQQNNEVAYNILISILNSSGCENIFNIHDVFRFMKKIPNTLREDIVSKLMQDLRNNNIEIHTEQSKPMSWSQISEMSNNGFDIGSHTVNHPILATCNTHEMNYELLQSKKTIEKSVGKNIISIAYPNGGVSDYNAETIELAKKAGYKIGFSYITGRNYMNNIEAFDLKRLHVEEFTNLDNFICKLSIPRLFDQT